MTSLFFEILIGILISVIILELVFIKVLNSKFKAIDLYLNELTKENYYFKLTQNSSSIKIIDKLRKKLLNNNFKFQVLFSKVSSVSDDLSITIEDTAKSTELLNGDAKTLSDLNNLSNQKINSTLDKIKEILVSFEKVKNTSQNISTTSSKSKEIIVNGLQEMMSIVNTIKEIKVSTDKTVKNINSLKQVSSEISLILETINDISGQTSMLALNASIEAARAGEAGKGFSVVAHEISTLANNSKNSVTKISDLMSKIETQIDVVVEAAIPNQKNVEKSVKYSQNIESTLNEIKLSVDNILSSVNEIIYNVDNQYSFIENINTQFSEVQDSFNSVNAKVENMYSSVENQNQNINELINLKQFLTNASSSLQTFSKKIENDIKKLNTDDAKIKANRTLELIKSSLLNNNLLTSLDKNIHEKELSSFLNAHDFIEAIWTNNSKGKFIYSKPANGIANAKQRTWFKEGLNGKDYISEIYISSITSNPCITISMPILNDKHDVVGVLGADLSINL